MTEQQKAVEILETLNSAGWKHIKAIFDEHIKLPKDELFEIMSARPETVTGKAAFLRAGRSKGCSDLLEEIESKPKLLIPTRERGS